MGLRHFRRHSTAVFDHPVEFGQFAHGMNFYKPENDNEINGLKIFCVGGSFGTVLAYNKTNG